MQILGNHEGQYLDGGTKFWPKGLQIDTAETIRSWWATGRMRVAAAFEIAGAANQHEAPDHDLAIDSCPTGSLLVTMPVSLAAPGGCSVERRMCRVRGNT